MSRASHSDTESQVARQSATKLSPFSSGFANDIKNAGVTNMRSPQTTHANKAVESNQSSCTHTLKPSLLRQALWASMNCLQASSPLSTMHSSRTFFDSGHAQQIFFLRFPSAAGGARLASEGFVTSGSDELADIAAAGIGDGDGGGLYGADGGSTARSVGWVVAIGCGSERQLPSVTQLNSFRWCRQLGT